MKRFVLTTVGVLALCGCTPNSKTPEQIRQDAAGVTDDAARAASKATDDARAAVQGVQDGLKNLNPTNINTASEADLASLPGMTDDLANKVILGRPYASTSDLLSRHIVSGAEYDRLSGKIVAH